MVKSCAEIVNVFYRFLYLPSNGTIADIVFSTFNFIFEVRRVIIRLQYKLCNDSERPRQICLDLHGSRRVVALVIIIVSLIESRETGGNG